jgi:elongation factor Ts
VELLCETDFVARNEEFKKLAHELCLQVASMAPKDIQELLAQEYIRDPQKRVQDLLKETIGKLGENIVIRRFERFELGA